MQPPQKDDRDHTPGPWNAAAGPSSVVGWPVVSAEGRSICNLTWLSHTMLPSLSDAEYADFMVEVRANAHLIAAAPDLLRELEALVSRLKAVTPPGTLGLNYKLDGARETIAKARAWRK